MSNINKKLGTINTIQPRIATGTMTGASTRVYMVNGDYGLCCAACKDDAVDYDQLGMLAGYYQINHSPMMAGSWDDILNDFGKIARQKMLDDGLAKLINMGTILAIIA